MRSPTSVGAAMAHPIRRMMPRGRGAAIVAVALAASACASWGKQETGAVAGGAAGAVVGGVVGNQTGSTTRGAIIGAVVGGAAGAIIGGRMDRQAAEMEAALPGAVVERVGEGVQVTFASGLLFDFDSDRVRADAGANLRAVAESLAKYPDTQALIVGHTDSEGSDTYNQALSQRRATTAWNFLVAEGVGHSRMQTAGRGELEPIATNETAYGRQQNRRIEIAIFASQAARTGAATR